ncbi:MAG: helix-turn-helix domain-containing protein [Steroidobacteraceae bacterium]
MNLAPIDGNQRYTPDESCAYLRISRAFLYQKIRSGELRVLKDGRRTFISGVDLISASRPQQS